MVRKEGSSIKTKSTNLMLEKAIRDLEKIVAETRPPSMEVPEADNSSQAVKRRMPPEIKLTTHLNVMFLCAYASYGTVNSDILGIFMDFSYMLRLTHTCFARCFEI